MTATIVRLLPADEQALLSCYVAGAAEPPDFDALYKALGVPAKATPPRLAIAVAQILLHHIQDALPQWAWVTEEELDLNRKPHKRHKEARLAFNPRHIFTINWADSGPCFSWPEAYHATYLPGFDKFVITSSRDGPDLWGCADHAIGVADGSLRPGEAAKGAITGFWRWQFSKWDQARWEYMFSTGLVTEQEASDWADEVWSPPKEEDLDQ